MRRLWDETVAEAMGWNPDELAHLRELLNTEPHVRGLGYNQYADEMEDIEDMETDPDDETPRIRIEQSPGSKPRPPEDVASMREFIRP